MFKNKRRVSEVLVKPSSCWCNPINLSLWWSFVKNCVMNMSISFANEAFIRSESVWKARDITCCSVIKVSCVELYLLLFLISIVGVPKGHGFCSNSFKNYIYVKIRNFPVRQYSYIWNLPKSIQSFQILPRK